MLFSTAIIAFALQVGPNQPLTPLPDAHQELRDRAPREGSAISDPNSQWLASCLGLIEENAARAHTLAQVRRNETLGAERVLANHCLGLAASDLGRWDEAANAFWAAREETPETEQRMRARFGALAGNAHLAAGQNPDALLTLSAAKSDAQMAASATLEAIASTDLARAMVAMEMPDRALAALDDAIRLLPENAESWLLKATLLRRLDRLDEAQGVIERASELAPLNSAVGLEAGVIAILAGREEAARQSWQSVIDLAPESPAALTAQDYLAQLGPPSAPAVEEAEVPQ